IGDAITRIQENPNEGVFNGSGTCKSTNAVPLLTWTQADDPPGASPVSIVVNCNTRLSNLVGRSVRLSASTGGAIATADVTFFDDPSGTRPTDVSITCWKRGASQCP